MPNSQDLQDSLDQAFDLVENEPTNITPTTPVARRAGSRRTARAPQVEDIKLSGIPQYLGLLLILSAFGIAAAPQLGVPENALTTISMLGITPGLLLVSGILLAGLAWLQATGLRNSSRVLSEHIDHELSSIANEVSAMAEEARNANPQAAVEQGLETQAQVLVKIETMIANLTKAVRMHNKPLVDIVGMATDLAKQGSETQTKVDSVKHDLEAIERGMTEVRTADEKHWEGLFQRINTSDEQLDDRFDRNRDALFERLEQYIVRENGRLTSDVETHVDLLREQLEKAVKEMETSTQGELRAVASRVDELAKQGGGGKGSSLDPKWMQGLEQNLAQVRRVVEEIAMRPASAGSTTSSSGSASSSYESQSGSTSNATSASTSTSTPEPAAAAGDGEGPGGKKVMSAIERLKKLRGN
ncbi:MAG: hypothetical protein KDC95_22950 [Planctomycetes bacterium]|nr:hypothetical protein [Planctomycetota bacterium]